jgi:uncharacterized membrane protein YuzA (DUF378 family)
MNLYKLTWWLVIIGGLNWGLVALGTGLGEWLPGDLMRVVYLAIGVSAVYQLAVTKK